MWNLFLGLVAVGSLSLPAASAGPVGATKLQGKRVNQNINLNTKATHYAPLRAHQETGNGGLRPRRAQRRAGQPGPWPKADLRNVDDVYYIIDLKMGNQTVPVSVDTGSSDTWFIQDPLFCIPFDPEISFPHCGFSPGFTGNFSGGSIPNQTFARAYTDGTFVTGWFGYEDVYIGSMKVSHQQLALVNQAAWFGDGFTAGLLGLAYPMMTGLDDNVPSYDPIFTSMWKNNLTTPLFSLALSRRVPSAARHHNSSIIEAGHESYLAFGGVPPVSYDDASWGRTPIKDMQILGNWPEDHYGHGLYVIVADSYQYGRGKSSNGTTYAVTKNTTQFPISVDCGSTLTVLPRGLAMEVYSMFDPPATLLPSTGLFYAPCNATVPSFGLQIGDKVFYVSPDDLLRQSTTRDYEGHTMCRVGVTDSYDGPYVLGVTFLSNVVAVFDVGNSEMRFASRLKY